MELKKHLSLYLKDWKQMTPREFDKQQWSSDTKVRYGGKTWEVRSVNFNTGTIVIKAKYEYMIAVSYKDVKITS